MPLFLATAALPAIHYTALKLKYRQQLMMSDNINFKFKFHDIYYKDEIINLYVMQKRNECILFRTCLCWSYPESFQQFWARSSIHAITWTCNSSVCSQLNFLFSFNGNNTILIMLQTHQVWSIVENFSCIQYSGFKRLCWCNWTCQIF